MNNKLDLGKYRRMAQEAADGGFVDNDAAVEMADAWFEMVEATMDFIRDLDALENPAVEAIMDTHGVTL